MPAHLYRLLIKAYRNLYQTVSTIYGGMPPIKISPVRRSTYQLLSTRCYTGSIRYYLTEGTNITLNKVISGTITPPQPGATMNLSTGVITPEMEYGKAVTMGIKDYSLQYIMLPVRIQNQ